MRILAITNRILKELFRDKRTLAMMFVAPIFVLWLMNLMFSSSDKVSVNLATYNVPTSVTETLKTIDNVTITDVNSNEEGNDLLNNNTVDAIITYNNDTGYTVTYENTDAIKTSFTRQVLISSLVKTNTTEIIKKLPPQINILQYKSTINENFKYGNKDTNFFTKMIPIIVGFIVFFFVFLISGMGLLKERTSGTLERLLATPVRHFEIVFGYMLSYGILAIIQTTVIVISAVKLLKIELVGKLFYVIIVNVILALIALSFGLLLSALAKSEFQMMQFIPLVIIPQLFLSGIIPLKNMGVWAVNLGKFLPLTYAGEALSNIILHGYSLGKISQNIVMLIIFLVVLTILNIIGLRRYRKV
ncbi:putative ABC transporter [Gemella bergeri ATCC 700627]|uniref:Putative ABC transporter n=1 Tax=Gemella bergeri ATCC 700627 TaxID=1321820 RepID=U2S0Z4_9BACL|nr:ABC transporter permease [Gemella bergeri]ERK56472.1 putative ABC transporter [Gemella bergeri ATCC 700627]